MNAYSCLPIAQNKMKLEDFPRLTEMKGGISSIAGVEEVVSVLQKQKDCVSVNVDILKQRSRVLSIISATEKNAYLDHFLQLDGLNCLHEWLMQAQKCTDCAVEEFVNTLLTAIERLPANGEKVISCGIMITVEQLRGHKSITVKNKAKALLDRWSYAMIGGTGLQCLRVGVEENVQPIDTADLDLIGKDLSSARAIGVSVSDERAAEESVPNESHHLNSAQCSDSSQVENNTLFMTSNQTLTVCSSNSTCIDEVGDCNSSGSSLVLNSCQEKSSAVPSESPALEMDQTRYCSFHTACKGDVNMDNMQHPAVGDVKVGPLEIELDIERLEGYKCTSPQKETFDLSSSSTLYNSMPPDESLNHVALNLVYREAELSSLNNVEYQENDSECEMPEFLRTSKETCRIGDSQEISVDANLNPNMHAESTTAVDSNQLGSKPTRTSQKSVFRFEDEEMDALEVARQVAVEVELEVVGYREHISNSPDVLCGGATGAHSPVLADDMQDKPGLDVGELSDCLIDDQMKDEQVSESPRMMPVAIAQNLEMENNQHGFDLNEDIYEGEIECSASDITMGTAKFSSPIVVFASKGVPGLPVASAQFDSESGWRGYSATSAFRPISPRKKPDCAKASDLKKKLNFLEIDLNVAETRNDDIADPACDHPWESSMEVRSRKEKKLKLDLNRNGDGDVTAAEPSLNYRIQLHDGDHSLSTACSSSSSKQHYARDFDLNDNPTALVDADGSSHHVETTSRSFPMCRSSKPDEPDDDLNLPVDRKLCKSRSEQEPFPSNGMFDNIIPAKPLMHHSQICPAYGYDVLKAEAAVPGMPTVLYGPGNIRYIVDSRGTTLIPLGLSGSFPTVTSLAPCEAGRRKVESSFNHIFTHNAKLEENLNLTSPLQPSGSGMVLKRKEPDSRLEGRYPLGFKQMPLWK